MPHTHNKKKKALAQSLAQSTKPHLHSKRQEIQDVEGWTHIVETPRRAPPAVTVEGGLQTGDFERGGVWYVWRTEEEMRGDLGYYGRRWEEAGGRREVGGLLGCGGEVIKEGKEGGKGEARGEGKMGEGRRRQVKNVVVLGLGSLQSARREGRRASWTQLVALRNIVEIMGIEKEGEEKPDIVFQDPQFTDLDKEFLTSLGYTVLEHPHAFDRITEESLVYAIHCYANVYETVSRGKRPAMLVGTDVENFGRFNTSEKAEAIARSLREMVEGCEEIEFPQVRHDFSDTKIYWRMGEGKKEELGKELGRGIPNGDDSQLPDGSTKDLEKLAIDLGASELTADPTKDLEKLTLDLGAQELAVDPTKDPEKAIIDTAPAELAVGNDK